MNPVEYVFQNLSPDFSTRLAQNLSCEALVGRKCMEAYIPVLVSGLIVACADRDKLNQTWDLIRNPALLDVRLLGFGKQVDNVGVTNDIAQYCQEIFGPSWHPIQEELLSLNGIASNSGWQKSVTDVTSIVFSILQKKIQENNWGSDEFSTWLANHKAKIFSMVPPSISEIMNLGPKASNTSEAPQEKYKPFWWIWLIGILALIASIFMGLKTCQKDVSITPAPRVKNIDPYAGLDLVTRSKWENLGLKMNYRLLNGNEYEFPDRGVELKLITYLDDPKTNVEEVKWFDFDRILFSTGSAELNPASLDQIGGIYEILNAYPNIEVKIGGYTDNVGDPAQNLQLSQARAERIMKELITMGISSNRLKAEGYGEQHPVGDNNTEEGRELNRRVALRVMKM